MGFMRYFKLTLLTTSLHTNEFESSPLGLFRFVHNWPWGDVPWQLDFDPGILWMSMCDQEGIMGY